MASLTDLIALLAMAAAIGSWLHLSRAREHAAAEARRLCHRHGLQLLDESVGLQGLRLRRHGGRLMLERCYAFDVSIDGDDREPSRLWMSGSRVTGFRLPTIATRRDDDAPPAEMIRHEPPRQLTADRDNVVPLRPRLRDDNRPH